MLVAHSVEAATCVRCAHKWIIRSSQKTLSFGQFQLGPTWALIVLKFGRYILLATIRGVVIGINSTKSENRLKIVVEEWVTSTTTKKIVDAHATIISTLLLLGRPKTQLWYQNFWLVNCWGKKVKDHHRLLHNILLIAFFCLCFKFFHLIGFLFIPIKT